MSIYKDSKTNTWYCKFRYKDYTGKIRQTTKRGFEKKGDAKQWEHDFLANRQGSPDMLFSDLAAKYLEDKRANKKEITYKTDKSRIETWIAPTFKDWPINKIDAKAVRQWQNELRKATTRTGKPLSENYRHNIVAVLSNVFAYAVKLYDLPQNPVKVAGNTAGERTKRKDYWTLEQFQKFIATFPEHDAYYAVFMVLYWTGMRLGELQALTVADVLPDRIRINKTGHVFNGEFVVTAPKTKTSIRDIHITPELHAVIEEYQEKLYKPKKTDRLFPIGYGRIMRQFKMHMEAAELPCIRIHGLRHSHASLLINEGYDALVVRERLGHKSVATTIDTYSHLFESKQAELVEKMSQIWVE